MLDKFTIADNGKTPPCSVGGRVEGAVSGYKDRVSTTDDVRKKLGESRIGCSGRPDLQSRLKLMMTVGFSSCSSGGIHAGEWER